jgi:hypothetical protein
MFKQNVSRAFNALNERQGLLLCLKEKCSSAVHPGAILIFQVTSTTAYMHGLLVSGCSK